MVMKVYTPEFKADAVALYHSDPDLTIAQAARDLGVHSDTLSNWVRADARGATTGTTSTRKSVTSTTPGRRATPEQMQERIDALEADLKAARKENATLAMERDILRKATKFFASEMTW
ncbi:transposase [Nonomuraea sp. B12E4]|uniref:transposase n=1 Tax=Nonomuraea sp. B12E4 TaxID=3153564 RepID=UPI00325D8DA9